MLHNDNISHVRIPILKLCLVSFLFICLQGLGTGYKLKRTYMNYNLKQWFSYFLKAVYMKLKENINCAH